MRAEFITADENQRAPNRGFRARELKRLLAFVTPYRRALLLGMLLSLVFAGAHTLSVGGIFPVFKVLLEEEGLHGWLDRMTAGQRLGADIAARHQARDVRGVTVLRVEPDGPLAGIGVEPPFALRSASITDSDVFTTTLAEIARAPAGEELELGVQPSAAGEANGNWTSIRVVPHGADNKHAMMAWAARLAPVADTADAKLKTLVILVAALVLLVVVANIFRYYGEVFMATAILRGLMDLRAALYRQTLRLPMSYFAKQSTADLVTRFVQDMQEIQRGLVTLFTKAVREPLRAVFILGLALAIDWRVTLTMIVVGPVAMLVFWRVGASVKKANTRLLVRYGEMIDALTVSLQNLRLVKAYTAEDYEDRRLDRVDRSMFKQQLKLAKLQAFLSPAVETLGVVAASLVTVWLAAKVVRAELSPSMFVQLGVVLAVLFDPLRKLSDVWVRVQRSTSGAERIFQVLDAPVETDRADGRVEVGGLERSLDFEHVRFTYPGADRPALDGVSLSIRRGETVAVVGPNGSGKTTLVSLLLRFFDPQEGRVLYDGRDLRDVTLASLRRQVSLVTQEAIVFAGTPQENIAYGNGSVDAARVRQAAQRAFADEFISAIPGRYEAALGERGTTLSGGQRQRLAIARAIFRDAPILIFDEATSQIDSESELKIQQALREFSRGRTTIIIAHRLSTIQFAERIVVMDAGRIVDSGRHAELYVRCPLYRTLCETQLVREDAGMEEVGS